MKPHRMSPQPLDVCLYRREFRGRLGSRVQQASRTIWIRGSGLSPLHVYKSAVARPRRVCTGTVVSRHSPRVPPRNTVYSNFSVSPLSCLPAEYRPQRKTPAQYTRAVDCYIYGQNCSSCGTILGVVFHHMARPRIFRPCR